MRDGNRIGVTAKQLTDIKRVLSRLIQAEIQYAARATANSRDQSNIEWNVREARLEFNRMFVQRNVNANVQEVPTNAEDSGNAQPTAN
jgi:hypothetical protein